MGTKHSLLLGLGLLLLTIEAASAEVGGLSCNELCQIWLGGHLDRGPDAEPPGAIDPDAPPLIHRHRRHHAMRRQRHIVATHHARDRASAYHHARLRMVSRMAPAPVTQSARHEVRPAPPPPNPPGNVAPVRPADVPVAPLD